MNKSIKYKFAKTLHSLLYTRFFMIARTSESHELLIVVLLAGYNSSHTKQALFLNTAAAECGIPAIDGFEDPKMLVSVPNNYSYLKKNFMNRQQLPGE